MIQEIKKTRSVPVKYETVEEITYRTSDGCEYKIRESAEKHQKLIDACRGKAIRDICFGESENVCLMFWIDENVKTLLQEEFGSNAYSNVDIAGVKLYQSDKRKIIFRTEGWYYMSIESRDSDSDIRRIYSIDELNSRIDEFIKDKQREIQDFEIIKERISTTP